MNSPASSLGCPYYLLADYVEKVGNLYDEAHRMDLDKLREWSVDWKPPLNVAKRKHLPKDELISKRTGSTRGRKEGKRSVDISVKAGVSRRADALMPLHEA
ncbi:hypothetical protein P879_08668 [Paragonimus westermani]|uniref:Uncharacterized protein n=1 Tax=Paragonimus westermani TaxID=34504 RepID=A0A8T0DIJ2_9TREM|nr:hypothetical protein P879_08668 [Paragonimus westermani]